MNFVTGQANIADLADPPQRLLRWGGKAIPLSVATPLFTVAASGHGRALVLRSCLCSEVIQGVISFSPFNNKPPPIQMRTRNCLHAVLSFLLGDKVNKRKPPATGQPSLRGALASQAIFPGTGAQGHGA